MARRTARRATTRRTSRKSTPRSTRRAAPRSARRAAPRSARRAAPRSARRSARRAARRTAMRKPVSSTVRRAPGRTARRSAVKRTASKRKAPVVSDQSAMDSFLAGFDTKTSSEYNLDKMFKEPQRGYKVQRVAKKSGKKSAKGKSPYQKFVAEQSPIVRKENPNMKQADVMREIGKRWKSQK